MSSTPFEATLTPSARSGTSKFTLAAAVGAIIVGGATVGVLASRSGGEEADGTPATQAAARPPVPEGQPSAGAPQPPQAPPAPVAATSAAPAEDPKAEPEAPKTATIVRRPAAKPAVAPARAPAKRPAQTGTATTSTASTEKKSGFVPPPMSNPGF